MSSKNDNHSVDMNPSNNTASRSDFVRDMIRSDLKANKYDQVVTRFPPEPNGYLHIGHAKSIILNFGVAAEFGGRCNLRFDDTNPETEEEEYAQSIIRDIRWLGYDWGKHLYYASDYFEQFYEFAVELIKKGLAYVDSQSEEEIRQARGTVMEPGRDSPYRERSVEENLDLLARMRDGEFPNGAHVLRAKIDMSASNMKMRDPLLYRIRNLPHYRSGDAWHIYPMYDFAHCLEDAIERISHSLCTLEFENNRDIYDWILETVTIPRPRPYQTEFARLSLTYTVMSKRKLLSLVKTGKVSGWDDPRMPTLAGMRRRGYTPQAIKSFCEDIGVAKANATVEIERLEHALRDDLNSRACRMMGVLNPVEVVVENWPQDKVEWIDAPLWPHDVPKKGVRKLPFSKRLFIEREDFEETPPKGFRRLSPGSTVRLRHAFVVKCTGVEKENGRLKRIRVSYQPEDSGPSGANRIKVKGAIHWVSADHSVDMDVRLYGRLFSEAYPEADPDRSFEHYLNEDSFQEFKAKCEPALRELGEGFHVQLERQGYFFVDPVDFADGKLVLNRTVPLRDSWAKVVSREDSPGNVEPKKSLGKQLSKPGVSVDKVMEAQAKYEVQDPPALGSEAIRLRDRYSIRDDDARVLASRPELTSFFEDALVEGVDSVLLVRWVINDLAALAKERTVEALPFSASTFGLLIKTIKEEGLSQTAAKTVLQEMAQSGEAPSEIISRLNLLDRAGAEKLNEVATQVVASHPDEATRYREGKKGIIGFFVGKAMKELGGASDPLEVRSALERTLG